MNKTELIAAVAEKAEIKKTEAEKAVKILGGGKVNFAEKKLPNLSDVRAVIYVDKIKSTPKNFPRKAGTPAKNPLL